MDPDGPAFDDTVLAERDGRLRRIAWHRGFLIGAASIALVGCAAGWLPVTALVGACAWAGAWLIHEARHAEWLTRRARDVVLAELVSAAERALSAEGPAAIGEGGTDVREPGFDLNRVAAMCYVCRRRADVALAADVPSLASARAAEDVAREYTRTMSALSQARTLLARLRTLYGAAVAAEEASEAWRDVEALIAIARGFSHNALAVGLMATRHELGAIPAPTPRECLAEDLRDEVENMRAASFDREP